jgi:hypothetical protein
MFRQILYVFVALQCALWTAVESASFKFRMNAQTEEHASLHHLSLRQRIVRQQPGLLSSIRAAQAQKTTEYTPRKAYPPLQWARQEGVYDSFVHLNFHGELPSRALLRNGYAPDVMEVIAGIDFPTTMRL